jgi:hypothetical protein
METDKLTMSVRGFRLKGIKRNRLHGQTENGNEFSTATSNSIGIFELYGIPAVNSQAGESGDGGVAEGDHDAGGYSSVFGSDSYRHQDVKRLEASQPCKTVF